MMMGHFFPGWWGVVGIHVSTRRNPSSETHTQASHKDTLRIPRGVRENSERILKHYKVSVMSPQGALEEFPRFLRRIRKEVSLHIPDGKGVGADPGGGETIWGGRPSGPEAWHILK